MLNENSNVEGFYQQQNIRIRKEIRQMDLHVKQLLYNSKLTTSEKEQIISKLNLNFLVIGPSKSGKTSLLKTMNFALNSNLNPQISISELPGTVIKKYQIKKNKKYQIQGLAKLKETDHKKAVTAIQFEEKPQHNTKYYASDVKSNKISQKYSNALQMIDNRIFGCFKISPIKQTQLFKPQSELSCSLSSINTVLIVFNIIGKIQFEQMSCIKFFINDIREKGIKILIILTHVDKLNQLNEKDKLLVIQERIQMLRKQFDFKDRQDFICIENYHDHSHSSTSQKHKIPHHYLSPTSDHHAQNINRNHNYTQNQMTLFSNQVQKGKYPYKKVSQVNIMEESFKIQVPIIGKHQLFNQISDKQILNLNQEKNAHFNKSITQNNPINHPYAKVSAKTISSQSNISSTDYHNSALKSNSLQNSQYSSSLNQPSYQNLNYNLSSSFKNSQEINFYSLKLLMKILKESEKYTQSQFKQKKILKWFCG